ncbi:MAG: hypothetical protein IPM12_02655 [Flavobacteriales bacterium]|nr:hypothetical protein [Flavobacteriales bacterium]
MRSTLLPFVLLALASHAQPTVQVSSCSFSTGIHPTLSFQFEGTDVKYVESWWKDELKRVSRDVSNKKEVVAASALLPQISPDTVRVLMKAEQRKGAPFTVAHVAFLTKEGWLGPSSDARAFEGAKAYVQQQSTMLRRQLAQQELSIAEKGLSKLEQELSNLQREKERMESSIEKAKQRAAEAVQEQERLVREAEEQAARWSVSARRTRPSRTRKERRPWPRCRSSKPNCRISAARPLRKRPSRRRKLKNWLGR